MFWYDQNVPAWQRYEVTALPPMSLNSLAPDFALVNAPDTLLNAIGTSFPADATIQVNGTDQVTAFVDDTSLTTTLTAAGAAGESQITVNSVSMNKLTGPLPFTWAAVISMTTIAPLEAVIGDPDFTLVVTGTNFTPDCVIDVAGVAVPTNFVSDTELTTLLSSAAITAAGPVPINVYALDSFQTSEVIDFNWRLAPVLTTLAPDTAAVATVTSIITVTGENFSTVAGEVTVIYQDGKALPATVVASDTSCSVTIVAPRLPQTEEITVMNGAIASRSPPLIFTWT